MSQDELKEVLRGLSNMIIVEEEQKLPSQPRPAVTQDVLQQADVAQATAERWDKTENSPLEPPVSTTSTAEATTQNTQRSSTKEHIKQEAEQLGSRFDYSDEEEDVEPDDEKRERGMIQENRSTLVSSEKEVVLRASIPDQEPTKTMQPIMFKIHPLQLAPISPAPPIAQVPRMPQRPARPLSLRLSAIPRRGGLTTSRILVVDPDKQVTSEGYSTQPHTGYITAAPKGAPIKYGRGKHAMTELIPQPSDDPQDPLNWQTWRKDLHFYALLTTVAMCNVMKTALVSVNRPLANNLSVSYIAVTALTGVPLMLSAFSGLASSGAAKVWGRRPVYLASVVLLFIGIVWNAAAKTSYGHFMAARIFQGLGWGAFDTIVVGSIMDIHFEHERNIKIAAYRLVSVAATWGPPILGGLVVQNSLGVILQFEILAIFQIISIPLIVLGVPETMYDRTFNIFEKPTPGWTPRTGWSNIGLKSSSRFRRLPAWARGRDMTVNRVIQYVKDVAPPVSYRGAAGAAVVDPAPLLLQALRAVVAPTTLLAFLTSFLPSALLWGLVASLSGLFARAPYNLTPATVGSLLATPFILSAVTVAVFFLFWSDWSKTGSAFRLQTSYLFVLAAGAALSLTGILTFTLYVASRTHAASTATATATPSANDGQGLRFSALSFALGLLAAGAHALDAPAPLLVRRAAQFTAPSLSVALRSAADMDAGVAVWRALAAGVFAMGIPAAVVTSVSTAAATAGAGAALKSTGIGVGVMQILVAGGVGAVWYWWDESILWLDGRVLACVDRTSMRSSQSFFEADD